MTWGLQEATLENSMAVPQKVKPRVATPPSSPTAGYPLEKYQHLSTQAFVHEFIAALFISAKKVETTQMSTCWIDKLHARSIQWNIIWQ